MTTHRRTYSTDAFQPNKIRDSLTSQSTTLRRKDNISPISQRSSSSQSSTPPPEKRFSMVGKWFCDRLLRVKAPQSVIKQDIHTSQQDLITQLQTFKISDKNESDALNKVIKGLMNNSRISIGILGRGSEILLNVILSSSNNDGDDIPFILEDSNNNIQKLSNSFDASSTNYPCNLVKENNTTFRFYGPKASSNLSKGEHSVICMVDQQGLTLSTRAFLEESGFLHKLIRHPQEYKILFLLDEENLGEFTSSDVQAILRQQFVALLKEHAPGPYSCIAPRIAATAKIIPVRPHKYLELNLNNSSKQLKNATGIPTLLCTLQNFTLGESSDAIKNISKDWIEKARPPNSTQLSTCIPPISHFEPQNSVSRSFQQKFQSIKEIMISGTRSIDITIAKTAKISYNDWSIYSEQINHSDDSLDTMLKHSSILANIISRSLTTLNPNFTNSENLFLYVPNQMNTIIQLSSELLPNCLHSSGIVKNIPTETDKVRIKRLAEFCQLLKNRTLQRVDVINQTFTSVNIHQLIRDACQHVLISSSLNGTLQLISGDAFTNLPLKAAQRIRLQLTEISSRTLSLLSDIEQDLYRSSDTILGVLQTSPFELQQKPSLSKLILSKTSSSIRNNNSTTIQFRPFTNLVFDYTDWSLLSFLGHSLVPDNNNFSQQLRNSSITINYNNNPNLDIGNSQFRALAHQIYGAEGLYPVVRFLIVNEILENSKKYEPYFLATHCDLQEYVFKMSQDGEPGDHVTLLAFSNYYNVNLWLFSPVLTSPVLIQSSSRKQASQTQPRAIAYIDGNTFCSLIPTTISRKRKRNTLLPLSSSSFTDLSPPTKKPCFYAPPQSDIMNENNDNNIKISNSLNPFKQGKGILSLSELCTQTITNNISLLPSLQGSLPLKLVQNIISKVIEKQELQDEILIRLLDGSEVDNLDLSNCNTLDYACCAAISKHSSTLKRLNLDNCSKISNDSFALLLLGSQYTRNNVIENLSLKGCNQLENLSLQLIPLHSPNLQRINLSSCTLLSDTSVFDLLENCKNLKELNVSNCTNLTDHSFTLSSSKLLLEDINLDKCPKLTDASAKSIISRTQKTIKLFSIHGEKITDETLKNLANNCSDNIKSISFTCTSITDDGIFYFCSKLSQKCNSITYIDFGRCSLLTDSSIEQIAKSCKNLKYLSLLRCERISDYGIGQISKNCNEIQYLDISSCSKLTSEGYNQLNFPLLNTLKMAESNMEDNIIANVLSHCSLLKEVDLSFCPNLGELSIRVLSNHKNLNFLDISYCNSLPLDSLQATLYQLPNLQTLLLRGYLNLDSHIISHKTLNKLNLSWCKNLQNSALMEIKRKCPLLESLDISWCASLSRATINQIAPSLNYLNSSS